MTVQEESPVLVLPDNDECKQALRALLEMYKKRITAYSVQHPNQHPEIRKRAVAKEICGVAILERLLVHKSVVAWDASKEFMESWMKKSQASARVFVVSWQDAWDEIGKYCK